MLLTQADMFAPSAQGAGYRRASQGIVRALASEAANFQRPVFPFNGDSHGYVNDKPLTTSKWRSFYGLAGSVSNLNKVTIEGPSSVNEWVRVNVVSGSEVLRIQRVPFT